MLIEIESLKVRRGGVAVLHDVNLQLQPGEIYGLLGPNGAGKSTTIATLVGLLEPAGGRVRVFGENPWSQAAAVHARVGVLPEQNGFYDWMTALEYLDFFARLYGIQRSPTALRQRLDYLGLAPRPGQRIGTYSRGMKQRLGIARALLHDPPLLILDEPTNGLDPRGRREIHDLLLDLSANQGVGVLLCTHLIDDVDRLCQRFGIIVDGATVAEGALADLLHHHHQGARFRLRLTGLPHDAEPPAHTHLLSGAGESWLFELDPSVKPEEVWRDLLVRGWPIAEIHREGSGLEQLYLDVTEREAA